MFEKPKNLYNEEPEQTTTTTTSTKKSIQWEKPVGWDGRKPKEYKPSFLKVLKQGLFGDDMEPKDFRRYEDFMHELKIVTITALISIILTVTVTNSRLMTVKGVENEEKSAGLLNKGIDYLVDMYDDWKNGPLPVKVDTIVNVRKDTVAIFSDDDLLLRELDSIMLKYKQDSLALVDSLNLK